MDQQLYGGLEGSSLRFNSSCDAPESSKECEDDCGKMIQDCFVTCSDQGKCSNKTSLNRKRI